MVCTCRLRGTCKVILKYYNPVAQKQQGFCLFVQKWLECYNTYMQETTTTRKRRQDTKHAVYMLVNTNTNEHYVGITVCGNAVNRALKVRFQKHVRRAVTENKDWALCRSIREHGAGAFVMLLVDVVRGRKPAHAVEREIINSAMPELNTH